MDLASALGPSLDGAMPTLGPGQAARRPCGGGAAEDELGRLHVFGGLDLRAPIATHTDDQPLDIVWTAGVRMVADGGRRPRRELTPWILADPRSVALVEGQHART